MIIWSVEMACRNIKGNYGIVRFFLGAIRRSTPGLAYELVLAKKREKEKSTKEKEEKNNTS